MNTNLLSVVILSYNNGSLIYETIDSILSQNYSNLEIIVAVDGDNSFNEDEVARYLDTKKEKSHFEYSIINSVINRGTVKNLNNAIKIAHGSYIKIIAGDDTYPENRIFNSQVNCLNRSNALVVYGNLCDCDIEMNIEKVFGFYQDKMYLNVGKSNDKLFKYVCRKNPKAMATQAACYDREFFNKYGFFDERLKYIEDLPMCVRMFKQNIPFEYINENAVCHRNDSGISSSKDMFDVKRIAYYQELYTYFTQCLQPVSSRVGRVYVAMRIKICKFRIDYTEALKEKKGKKHQIMLVLRNIVPLCYYMVTNLGGALAHMLHR